MRAQGPHRRRGHARDEPARHASGSRSTSRSWRGPVGPASASRGCRCGGPTSRRAGCGLCTTGSRWPWPPCASAAGSTRRQPGVAAAAPTAGGAALMAVDAIDAMAKVERDHWWFRGEHRLVLDELRRERVTGTVVDVGAGTGGLLERLRLGGHLAVGMELDTVALAHARANQPRLPLARSFAEAVPVCDGRPGPSPPSTSSSTSTTTCCPPRAGRVVGPGGLCDRRARLPVGMERPRRPARAPPPLQPAAAHGRWPRGPGSRCCAARTSTPG